MSRAQLCSPPGPLSLHQEKAPKQKQDSGKGRAHTPHLHCSTPKPHRRQGSRASDSWVTPEQILWPHSLPWTCPRSSMSFMLRRFVVFRMFSKILEYTGPCPLLPQYHNSPGNTYHLPDFLSTAFNNNPGNYFSG